jgi:hypothetical protein
MLGHIYYAFGLIIVVSLLTILIKFNQISNIREWYSKFKKVTGKTPKEKDFRSKEESVLYSSFSSVLLFEFSWTILGLLTNSWYVFLLLFIITLIINLIKRPIEFTFIDKVLGFIIILLKLLIYLYLVINHYHLHFDTWSYIKMIF